MRIFAATLALISSCGTPTGSSPAGLAGASGPSAPQAAPPLQAPGVPTAVTAQAPAAAPPAAAPAAAPAAPAVESTSLYVADATALPACDSTRQNFLAYVATEKKLEACEGSAWVAIDLPKGADGKDGATAKDGAAGKDGVDGKDGSTNKVTATKYCSVKLDNSPLLPAANGSEAIDAGLIHFENVRIQYSISLLASQDKFVELEVVTPARAVTTANIFSSAQVGAKNGSASVVYDLAFGSDGGWWDVFETDDLTSIVVRYHDVAPDGYANFPAPNHYVQWTVPATACQIRTW